MSKYNLSFHVFITNLGKYNEGKLVGEWVKFPTDSQHIQEVFERIGIGSTDKYGQPYEEYFITDYDVVDGLYNLLGEYSNLSELNYLANEIEKLSPAEYQEFTAILESGDISNGSIADVINLTQNLDTFQVLPDVQNEYDLGYYMIEEAGIYDLSNMGNLSNYIDYERFGRDIAIEEGWTFTDNGAVLNLGGFENYYDGKLENIPEEYCLENIISNENRYDKSVIGYIYDNDGTHGDGIVFDGTPENMANFIMTNKDSQVVITDLNDNFVVSSTEGGFLDRVSYPALREEILQEILPLQLGDKEPYDVTTTGYDKEMLKNADSVHCEFKDGTHLEMHISSTNVIDYSVQRGEEIYGGHFGEDIYNISEKDFTEVVKECNLDVKDITNLEASKFTIDDLPFGKEVEEIDQRLDEFMKDNDTNSLYCEFKDGKQVEMHISSDGDIDYSLYKDDQLIDGGRIGENVESISKSDFAEVVKECGLDLNDMKDIKAGEIDYNESYIMSDDRAVEHEAELDL